MNWFRHFSKYETFKEIRRINDTLNTIYPPGSFSWTGINRPDLMRHARAAECAVDGAYLSGDTQGLMLALKWYQEVYTSIFKAFQESQQTKNRNTFPYFSCKPP